LEVIMSDLQEPFGEESYAEPSQETPQPAVPRRRLPSLFWPVLLIGVGVILLLQNMGVLSWDSWTALWRFWPLLIILLGLDVLIGRRSSAGSVVSALLIVLLVAAVAFVLTVGPDIPELAGWAQVPGWQSEQISYPLEGVEDASIYIDWSSPRGSLSALRDSSNLIEGSVDYRGELNFDASTQNGRARVELSSHFAGGIWIPGWDTSDKRWDLQLSPQVLLDLSLDGGSGRCEFDLGELRLDSLYLDVGSGSVELVLPARRSFEAEIDGGSGSLVIVLPRDVEARVELDSGSGSFNPDSRFRRVEGDRGEDGVWETEDYDHAEVSVLLRIDQGSGPIRIEH
jgi:hypothetical protein